MIPIVAILIGLCLFFLSLFIRAFYDRAFYDFLRLWGLVEKISVEATEVRCEICHQKLYCCSLPVAHPNIKPCIACDGLRNALIMARRT